MDQSDEKIDADILKGREDILRARKAADNRIPTPDKSGPLSSGKSQNQPRQIGAAPAEPSPLMKAVVDANKQALAARDTSAVPRFNVADRILTRQRHESAAKRTAPLRPQTAKAAQPTPAAAPKDQIEQHRPTCNTVIAQIVARDIHRLCYA